MSKVEEDEQATEFDVKFYVIPKSFGRHFPGHAAGLARSEPGGFVSNTYFAQNADKVYSIKPRTDDVWLLTFPKCGTTWTSELLWQVMHHCNYKVASEVPLFARVPFAEFPYFVPPAHLPAERPLMTVEKIEAMPSPRIIRPHLPFFLLPPNLLDTSKVVYVARNPKDVIVSYYFHHKLIKFLNFTGSIEEFAEYFMNDEVMYAPFFAHVLAAWRLRYHPNMHFMFYEDMKRDLRGEIERVASFLGQSLSEEQLTTLAAHLRFDNFEKNPSVNNESLSTKSSDGSHCPDGKFCRKGKTGDWMNHFDPELNAKIDTWIEKNLKGTDLKFTTELEYQD